MIVRQQILNLVERYPGIHTREVERQLGLASRLASYHLQALTDEGLVTRVEEQGYTRYVARPSGISAADVTLICVLRRPPALRIVLLLLSQEEMTPGMLADSLGLAKASVSYHLRELLDAGIVKVTPVSRERWYRLAQPTLVHKLLTRFEPLPGDLDEFSKLWDDLLK